MGASGENEKKLLVEKARGKIGSFYGHFRVSPPTHPPNSSPTETYIRLDVVVVFSERVLFQMKMQTFLQQQKRKKKKKMSCVVLIFPPSLPSARRSSIPISPICETKL